MLEILLNVECDCFSYESVTFTLKVTLPILTVFQQAGFGIQ